MKYSIIVLFILINIKSIIIASNIKNFTIVKLFTRNTQIIQKMSDMHAFKLYTESDTSINVSNINIIKIIRKYCC